MAFRGFRVGLASEEFVWVAVLEFWCARGIFGVFGPSEAICFGSLGVLLQLGNERSFKLHLIVVVQSVVEWQHSHRSSRS